MKSLFLKALKLFRLTYYSSHWGTSESTGDDMKLLTPVAAISYPSILFSKIELILVQSRPREKNM